MKSLILILLAYILSGCSAINPCNDILSDWETKNAVRSVEKIASVEHYYLGVDDFKWTAKAQADGCLISYEATVLGENKIGPIFFIDRETGEIRPFDLQAKNHYDHWLCAGALWDNCTLDKLR